MLLFGLDYLDIIPLTTADILTILSESNINPALSFIFKIRRIEFYYNIAKEVNVLGKFATTTSTKLRTIEHFRIIESDRKK